MKVDKNLPQKAINLFSTLSSGATLSYPPGTLGVPLRSQPKNHPVAELVGGNRDEFSLDYIAPNAQGIDILKSDKAKLTSPTTYEEILKYQNPHHHISGDQAMDDRIKSIINSMKQKNKP